MRFRLLAAAACLVAAALPPARAEDPPAGTQVGPSTEATPHQLLVARRAPAVVSVRMSIAISMSFRGNVQEHETNTTTVGVIVHPRGLVMIPNEGLGSLPRRFRSMVNDFKATPTSLRVVFPGDPKEYAAILGAQDSDLGLAFLLIKDLEGREVACLDCGVVRDPRLGETIYGVSRLGQDFDYAPLIAPVNVAAQITKPRRAWVLEGSTSFTAEPMYALDGAVVGIGFRQEGVGEDATTQSCLLPMSIAQSLIDRSLRAAEAALEDLEEAEEDGEVETPVEEKPAEEPADEPAEEPAEQPAAGGAGR